MSDFMRTIVQEALRPGSAKRHNAVQSGSAESINVSQIDITQNTPEIKRPNYQRDKKEQRLCAGSPTAVNSTITASATTAKNSTTAPLTREFIEQSLSPLLRMSLVQGNTGKECNTDCTDPPALSPGSGSGMIGHSSGGLSFWYYPELQPELFSELGIRHTSARSVGIVASERCTPSQLFLLDEVLGTSKLEYEINWNKAKGSAFQATVMGEQSSEIVEFLQSLSSRCQLNQEGSIRTYTSYEPSPILSKHLGIAQGNAITVWEGLSRYRSVALLDHSFKQGMSTRVKYDIAPDYLLLSGAQEELTTAIAVLQKVLKPYV